MYNLIKGRIGTKILQSVLDEIPDLLEQTNEGNALLGRLLGIKGIQIKTAQKIVDGLPDFKIFLEAIPDIKIIDFDPEGEGDMDGNGVVVEVFKNMRVIFTGVRDKELEEMITKSGGVVANTIAKTGNLTQIVVAKDPDADSNKLKSARDAGIEIMSLTAFRKKFVK